LIGFIDNKLNIQPNTFFYYLYIFIIGSIGIIGSIFISSGFNKRCPNCGIQSGYKHKKINNSGYVDAIFRCFECYHEFSREISVDWLERENEVGKEQAIREYKKYFFNS